MKIHVTSVHEKEKPCKCDFCEANFSLQSNLKKHIAFVHEGKKPFKCDVCDYICSQKWILVKHVSSVHEKKKPLQCDICDYTCSRNGNLRTHILHQFMRGKNLFNAIFVKWSSEKTLFVSSLVLKRKKSKSIRISSEMKKTFKCDFCEVNFSKKGN